MNEFNFNHPQIEKIISLALEEDIASSDITTDNLVDLGTKASGTMLAKQDGIIAGLPLSKIIFKKFDAHFNFTALVEEGAFVKKGELIAEFSGELRAILTAERTVLNFLQRMSGIASAASKYIDELNGTKTQLLDTRKTAPGHRLLDKYSVLTGGGTNHRIGLFDMVMIKDNHIKAAGGIMPAINKIKSAVSHEIKIEVETTNLDEVQLAIDSGADIIMLDNMSVEQMKTAVEVIGISAQTEASGNVTLETIKEIASSGVDFISVGAITHSVKAMDISLNINK